MLEYEVFKDIFDEKIFAKSKPDLLKKVAEYPDRYVGLFRPTKPEAKLLQNLLQSNEIRFGDAFEVAIKQYFINEGWQPLQQKIISKEGDALDIDQLLMKGDKVLFIEQKVRDDHDSTKKRGQISNFEKKTRGVGRYLRRQSNMGIFLLHRPKSHKEQELLPARAKKVARIMGRAFVGIVRTRHVQPTRLPEYLARHYGKLAKVATRHTRPTERQF